MNVKKEEKITYKGLNFYNYDKKLISVGTFYIQPILVYDAQLIRERPDKYENTVPFAYEFDVRTFSGSHSYGGGYEGLIKFLEDKTDLEEGIDIFPYQIGNGDEIRIGNLKIELEYNTGVMKMSLK